MQTKSDLPSRLRAMAFHQVDITAARALERAANYIEELEGKYTAIRAYLEHEQSRRQNLEGQLRELREGSNNPQSTHTSDNSDDT